MAFPNLKLFILAFTLAVAAGTPFGAVAQEGDYVFILTGRSNPYWTAMKNGIEDAAKKDHVNAVIYEAENERDAEGELNICQTAIQRKPKIIVMSSIIQHEN